MDGKRELRIVLLGKTGVGKSSAGNTFLGEEVFKEGHSSQSETQICTRYEKEINGETIVVIDTPGIFDTHRSEKDLKKEIISSLVECAPGPHVFILVLEVGRYTRENQDAVQNLIKYFTGNVVHHIVLLFTRGNDLKHKNIHDFIDDLNVEGMQHEGQTLKELAEKCGNRVHVIDNRHWNENSSDSAVLDKLKQLNIPEQVRQDIIKQMQPNQTTETPWFDVLSNQADSVETEYENKSEEQKMREYRTNKFQLTKLMKSIKTILSENNGQPYKNQTLEVIGEAIKKEMNNIMQELKDEGKIRDTAEIDPKKLLEIKRRAIERVRTKIERQLAGVAVGILLGALLGVGVGLAAPVVLVAGLIRAGFRKLTSQEPETADAKVETKDVVAGTAATTAVAIGVGAEIVGASTEAVVLSTGAATGIGAGLGAGVVILYGAGKGATSGYDASKTSDNAGQAVKKVSQALADKAEDVLKASWNVGNKTVTGDDTKKLLKKND